MSQAQTATLGISPLIGYESAMVPSCILDCFFWNLKAVNKDWTYWNIVLFKGKYGWLALPISTKHATCHAYMAIGHGLPSIRKLAGSEVMLGEHPNKSYSVHWFGWLTTLFLVEAEAGASERHALDPRNLAIDGMASPRSSSEPAVELRLISSDQQPNGCRITFSLILNPPKKILSPQDSF